MECASREALRDCLQHLQRSAGNASLITAELINTLAEHALGNYRVLTTMAAELLSTAAQHERPQLDEQLYLEVFGAPCSYCPQTKPADSNGYPLMSYTPSSVPM